MTFVEVFVLFIIYKFKYNVYEYIPYTFSAKVLWARPKLGSSPTYLENIPLAQTCPWVFTCRPSPTGLQPSSTWPIDSLKFQLELDFEQNGITDLFHHKYYEDISIPCSFTAGISSPSAPSLNLAYMSPL